MPSSLNPLRALAIAALSAAVLVNAATGQAITPRSQEYLLTPLVDDVRALWVNPAGLAIVREASLMAEAAFHQPENGDVRLLQWSLGFNTRGLSAGYQRDRLQTGTSNQLLRIGLARPFRRGAVGLDLSFYWSDVADRALAAGVTYELVPSVAGSLVIRNIGRPVVANVESPLTGLAGLGWSAFGNVLQLGGEIKAAERLTTSGFDIAYRASVRIASPVPFPVVAIAALELGPTDADRFFLGIALGGLRRILLGGSFSAGPRADLDIAHITGLATNRQTPIRR